MHIVDTPTRPFEYAVESAARCGRSPERATEISDASRFASRKVDDLPVALLAFASDGIVVMTPAGRVAWCNENFATMVGLPSCMVLDERLDDYFSSEDAIAFQNLTRGQALNDQRAGLRLRDSHGDAVPVRVSVIALPPNQHRTGDVAAVFTDLRGEPANGDDLVDSPDEANAKTSKPLD